MPVVEKATRPGPSGPTRNYNRINFSLGRLAEIIFPLICFAILLEVLLIKYSICHCHLSAAYVSSATNSPPLPSDSGAPVNLRADLDLNIVASTLHLFLGKVPRTTSPNPRKSLPSFCERAMVPFISSSIFSPRRRLTW